MQAHCPKCQSNDITRSKRRGWFESVIFTVTHVRAYRCLSCDFSFFGGPSRTGEVSLPWPRQAIVESETGPGGTGPRLGAGQVQSERGRGEWGQRWQPKLRLARK